MTELRIYMNREETKNGELFFQFSMCGNTFEKKEILKKLGYKYYPYGSWEKEVGLSELECAIVEALENDITLHSFDMLCHKIYLIDSILREKYINSVQVPEILKNKKFNKKIYGKEGSYRVYLDNAEVKISDEQAEEIQKWVQWESEKKNKEFINQLVCEASQEDKKEARLLIESQLAMAENIYEKYIKEEV